MFELVKRGDGYDVFIDDKWVCSIEDSGRAWQIVDVEGNCVFHVPHTPFVGEVELETALYSVLGWVVYKRFCGTHGNVDLYKEV